MGLHSISNIPSHDPTQAKLMELHIDVDSLFLKSNIIKKWQEEQFEIYDDVLVEWRNHYNSYGVEFENDSDTASIASVDARVAEKQKQKETSLEEDMKKLLISKADLQSETESETDNCSVNSENVVVGSLFEDSVMDIFLSKMLQEAACGSAQTSVASGEYFDKNTIQPTPAAVQSTPVATSTQSNTTTNNQLDDGEFDAAVAALLAKRK